ncbi:hypothetical protein M427DRAFT_219162 [Gonapodya prolifera JEL478]|uniref:Potassium channel tetramerisation-type BTB domain-containing protein n=1 Tax=Gonapodya prolifera (strain JEL478) TaxID=1344416 RepID=A0A138ZZQ9_GONPJ|nr:hypothetical protein M427DRAFT_219162 [Gonapodya prolifera JEL478]|eukprot:KXS09623.1 hypothetical protein M427DRAFT_219162 [Gonapodya prolifera JEL478]
MSPVKHQMAVLANERAYGAVVLLLCTTVETLKNGGGPSSSTYALRNSFRVSRQRSFSADAALFDGVGGLTTTFAAKPPPGARQQVGKVSLASHPPVQTFFSALFDPTRFSGPPTVDAEGRLFLDRDGDVFEYVLRYLRTGKIFSDEEDGSDDEMDSGAYESEDSEEGEETHEWAPGDEIGRTPPSSPRLPIESRNTSVTSPRSVGLEAAQQTRSTPSVMSRSHSDSHPTVEAGGSSQHDTSEATSSVSPPTGTRPTATVAASSSRGNANPPSSSAGHALRTLATLPLPIPRGPTNIPSSSSHPIQSAHSPPSGSGTLSPPPRVTRPLSAPTSHAAPPTAVPGSLRSNHARGQSFSAGGAAVTQAQRSQRTSSRKSLRGRTSVTTSAASGHNVTDSPSTGSFPTSLLLKVKAEGSFFALDNLVEKCERIVERRKREKEDREVAKEVVEYRTVDLTDVSGISAMSARLLIKMLLFSSGMS